MTKKLNGINMNEKFEKAVVDAQVILSSLKCDFADIRLSSGESRSISLSKDSTDSVVSGDSVGGSIRILKNGAIGFVTFNDIENLDHFIKKALNNTELINPLEKTRFLSQPVKNERFCIDAERDFKDVSFDEKFNLADRYNKILKSSDLIQTTRSVYRESVQDYAYINSEGSCLQYDRKYCGISLMSVSKKGNIIQPFHNSISGFGGFEIVENHEELAEEVLKTSVDMLSATPIDGGNYSVILDPKLSGVFIHEAFGHLSEADFVHENPGLRDVMVFGREFGSEELNVIDDGNIKSCSGYIPFDDEGVTPERTELITNGVLSGRLHSRETAARMNEKATGNGRAINVMKDPIVRMTNTYIENGKHDATQLFDSMEDGIYAVDVIGGQTNLEMFTFSSAYAYEIKNGKKGKMLRDVILSGNVFSTLKNIKMIGNDLKMFGGLGGCGKGGQGPLPVSFGGPHMRIDDVLVGGNE